jgi:hypothetical protein
MTAVTKNLCFGDWRREIWEKIPEICVLKIDDAARLAKFLFYRDDGGSTFLRKDN